MPAITSPFFNIKYGWVTGESGWGDPMNTNLQVLSFLGKGAVDSFVSSLPISPSNGVSVVNTGDNQFYFRMRDTWLFVAPEEGMEVNETSSGKRYKFISGGWAEIPTTSTFESRIVNLESFDLSLQAAGGGCQDRRRYSNGSNNRCFAKLTQNRLPGCTSPLLLLDI